MPCITNIPAKGEGRWCAQRDVTDFSRFSVRSPLPLFAVTDATTCQAYTRSGIVLTRIRAWVLDRSGNGLRERSRSDTVPAKVRPQHPPGEDSREGAAYATRQWTRWNLVVAVPTPSPQRNPARSSWMAAPASLGWWGTAVLCRSASPVADRDG